MATNDHISSSDQDADLPLLKGVSARQGITPVRTSDLAVVDLPDDHPAAVTQSRLDRLGTRLVEI